MACARRWCMLLMIAVYWLCKWYNTADCNYWFKDWGDTGVGPEGSLYATDLSLCVCVCVCLYIYLCMQIMQLTLSQQASTSTINNGSQNWFASYTDIVNVNIIHACPTQKCLIVHEAVTLSEYNTMARQGIVTSRCVFRPIRRDIFCRFTFTF